MALSNSTTASVAATAGAASNSGHGSTVHIVPLRTLVGIFVALVVLTILTVAATYVQLGAGNIWVALLIAAAKGALVALYFMHLRWDSPFNAFAFIVALLFVALMMGITILDTREYAPNYTPPATGNSRVFPLTGE